MFYDSEPRTWKWFVPGVISAILLWGGYVLFRSQIQDAGALLIVLGMFGIGLTVTNHSWVRRSRDADILKRRQDALSITPKQMMLEAAKGVHPETLRLLLGEQARRWGLVSGSQSPTGKPYKILVARPRVTEQFLVYFLRRSNHKMYMSKHGNLSDNDKSWDPRGITSTYEMYDDLESLLVEEMKCTRPFGQTKPGYWLGDWSPAAVGLDYGVDIEDWEAGDETEVIEAVASVNGSGEAVGRIPSVLAKAMVDLQQTSQMKAKTEKLFESKS